MITIRRHFKILKDGNYNAFPSISRLDNGQIMIAFRTAPDRKEEFGEITHIDPASKAVFICAKSGFESWDEKPSIVYDDFLKGVQDPFINTLKDGNVFASFFTWNVYHKSEKPMYDKSQYRFFSGEYAGIMGGGYTIRSTDNGRTWDSPREIDYPGRRNFVHPRGTVIENEDGSIIFPVSEASMDKSHPRRMVLLETYDKGKTWGIRSVITSGEGYITGEPNIIKTASGKILIFIRSTVIGSTSAPMLMSESSDSGKTWAPLKETNINEQNPFFPLKLNDGRNMLVYGSRKKPYGIKCRIVDSEFENISDLEEFYIRSDGLESDIGYPCAIELSSGNILIVYYYIDSDEKRYIAGTEIGIN